MPTTVPDTNSVIYVAVQCVVFYSKISEALLTSLRVQLVSIHVCFCLFSSIYFFLVRDNTETQLYFKLHPVCCCMNPHRHITAAIIYILRHNWTRAKGMLVDKWRAVFVICSPILPEHQHRTYEEATGPFPML